MSYLSQMPVDELKIDRAFVLQMLSGSRDGSLVRSSIELGHSLGLAVVAEGVEDRETMQALADLGCDVVQGFHLARPMSAADVPGWLRAPGPHRPAGAAVVTPRGPADA
jgi:EAL domain-containing protein (putative c-di-GMP-specific phosphodiesterase class I)